MVAAVDDVQADPILERILTANPFAILFDAYRSVIYGTPDHPPLPPDFVSLGILLTASLAFLAGSTIVFMLTISAFVTPRFIGGTRVPMLGSLIYEQVLIVLNWPFAAVMSVVLLSIALLIAAAAGRTGRGAAAR